MVARASTRQYTITINTTDDELLDRVCLYLYEKGALSKVVKRLLHQWISEKQMEYITRQQHEAAAEVPDSMIPW